MELPAQYNPHEIEDRLYNKWLENGLFHAKTDSGKKPYVIVIPPPNVTGVLHMGHGLNNTIQDIIIRFKKMQGFETCWIPGTDHAGIATQNVVEKKLKKERNLSRQQIGREEFIKEVWKWKEEHGSTIIKQLKKLGASCDWQRERFTMDEGLSKAVQEVFVLLYEEGLIYKGEYLVNWCPRCGTALSDEEAEHKEKEGGLWYIRYQIKGEKNKYVTVATTRPETMLGDTAVAVNPDDERYYDLKGKFLILPLVGRVIPVIQDSIVDRDFGTGCVKVTPAHDPNDFAISQRHNLEKINIFTPDAKTNENVPEPYRGLDRFECRKKVVAELKDLGHIVKEEKHLHAVAHCYRCDTVIEPRLSSQWFVKMKPLAEEAIKVVESGEIYIFPERWKKVYLNWMRNIKDWCISRQIWWGHRIPAWYCECGNIIVSRTTPLVCDKCKKKNLKQDEDVLDTWFSSWLWPFSTLGWPEKTEDLKLFYPTDSLITDPGIIFFWVARMIMAGLHFMKKIPFSKVFLHGTVMDSQGRKMSKSLGNGIDPLEIVETHGADALRYTITVIAPPGENLLLSRESFSIGRFFANKIWNAARYILQNTEKTDHPSSYLKDFTVADKWILDLLERVKEEVTDLLENFQFNEVCHKLYDFFWHSFCDWYIEISKTDKSPKTSAVLRYVLGEFLKLIHPVMPFISEELWGFLYPEKGLLLQQKWPVKDENFSFPQERSDFEFLGKIVYHLRNIRGEMEIEPSKKISVLVKTSSEKKSDLIKRYEKYISFLGRTESIKVSADIVKPELASVAAVDEETEIFVPLKENVDLEKERKRLEKEIEKLNIEYQKLKNKLENPSFIQKAPVEVVEEKKREAMEISEKLKILEKNLRCINES